MALKYQTFPLPSGTEATRFTVKKMVEQIRSGIKSPAVREKAVKIIRAAGVSPGNQRGEVAALFSFVKHTFRFVKDPTLVELIHTPEKLLEIRSGDCDDYTVILASLLGTVGYETRVAIVGPARGIWSHTFPEVWLAGKWLALDATPTPRHLVDQAKKSGNYKTFQLVGGSMLSGLGAVAVQKTVVVDGGKLYLRIVQETVDYLEGELSAGNMKPAELARYFAVIPADKSLTPLMKAAALKGVELVGAYRFGYSLDRLKQMSTVAGPGDLAFLGGIWKGIKKGVGAVVGLAKGALGISKTEPVKVKVELPPPTQPPGEVNVGGAKVSLGLPTTGEQIGQALSTPAGMGISAGVLLLLGFGIYMVAKRRNG